MRKRGRAVLALAAAALGATALVPLGPTAPVAAAPAAGDCDPIQTEPSFRGDVPSPEEVLGFGLGEREVTVEESDRFLHSVADASPRVVEGTLARSWQGRPLEFAIAGRPDAVTDEGLARIRENAARLRDPATSAADARRIARSTPAILWVAGNVHGNEESGADAALQTLYHLADRDDCAAERILDNALVVILPIQNPDGRVADSRRNFYGFDMNRDWFARTQPETDGKLEMLTRYPPLVFVDAHEMGGTSYFFPPNADPIYHEITDASLDWINNVYGAATAAEFDRQGIDFFTSSVFDLFYMGYGDTVPTTGFIGAGMTFEKGGASPIDERTHEQYTTQWVTLSAAAERRTGLLTRWHDEYVEAFRQGRDGVLEPNEVINPGNEVVNEVPARPVRHYFLSAGQLGAAEQVEKRLAVSEIVRNLQRMDVEVRRLTAPLAVPDLRPYGRDARPVTLPAGTYWIPMAQAQKHWVQAMLNEDTYTPFPFFFDVTAWSLPLLGNVGGGYSGARLSPVAERVGQQRQPAEALSEVPRDRPRVGLLQLSNSASAVESSGWLRYRLDQEWNIPHEDLTPGEVTPGALEGLDVLLVPEGDAAAAHKGLGKAGRDALAAWVNGGGRYVGWQGGAELASRLGVSTARLSAPKSDVPGTLFRVRADERSPLAAGVGPFAYMFNEFDPVMRASDPSDVVVSYPPGDSDDWFVSGFASGAAEDLGGTASVIDEAVGSGRAVVFASEPNFRAFTDGTARILLNAILGTDPARAAGAPAAPAGAAVRAAAERAAALSAAALPTFDTPIRVSVLPADATKTAAVLHDLGASWETLRSAGRIRFVVVNPRGLNADQHPWARQLPTALSRAGVQPIAVSVP
ncbi:MAG: M14 family zinc carboxypeptidase [Streptomycetales bacterium]